jgi:hypothetical protein
MHETVAVRVIAVILALALVSSLAFAAGAPRASACSCAPLPEDNAGARRWLSYGDVVLIGVVETTMGTAVEPAAVMRAERVYRGQIADTFSVTSSNCNGIIVPFEAGGRLVLALNRRDGGWEAHGCAAGVVDGITTARFQDGDPLVAALERIDSDGPLRLNRQPFVADGDQRWSDSLWAWSLIVAGSAFVLVALVWLVRRSAQSHR